MTMYNTEEKQKMKKFIKANPITYVCDDCGKEFKDRIPFPEGCSCGNACEDYFTEKYIEKKPLNDIKKFDRFGAIKVLHKTGDYKYRELMKKKNFQIEKLIKEIRERKDV